MKNLQFKIYKTLVKKELTRFTRIWTQTILPPIINQSLYFIIFGQFIGSQIASIQGLSYMQFLVPGLLMMGMINASYSNVVSSFFSAKFQRNIEEILVAPVSKTTTIFGFISGGILRGLLVGALIYLVSLFFTQFQVYSIMQIILFSILTASAFALAGLINGIYAKKFDDISIIPTFVLTPLTYFGGVFYTLESLPEFWLALSKFNPIVYMIDGFRAGFYNIHYFQNSSNLTVLIVLNIALFALAHKLIQKVTRV